MYDPETQFLAFVLKQLGTQHNIDIVAGEI